MIICSLFLLVLLLFCPSIAIAGSRYGATLWLTELLPTLLPFFIAIRLFQYSLPKAAGKRVFLLTGLLCGYPVGASLVTYQYDRNLLSREAAYFYLGFVNNPSPMFVLVFCGKTVLGLSTGESLILFGILVLSSLAGSLLFRFLYHGISCSKRVSSVPSKKKQPLSFAPASVKSPSEILDSIILDSFRVMINIGGYVILFSILGQLIHAIFPESSVFSMLGCGIMEISSGASYLKISTLPIVYRKALILAILSFGGLSAAFQTSSILTRSELHLLPYLLNKSLNSIIAGITALLLFRMF